MFWKTWLEKADRCAYYLLLLTVAVIPLQQQLAAICVCAAFLCTLPAALHNTPERKVLRFWEQGALYLLFAITWVSLHFSQNAFLSTYNFVYVVGQYAAMVFVLLRYGWQPPGARYGQASLTPRLAWFALPRPVQLISVFLAVSVLVSLLGLAQQFAGVAVEGVWVDPQRFPDLKVRAYSTLVNPNILGGYLVLVIAYIAAFGSIYHNKYLRAALLCGGALALACLACTYSRGNWLACGVMLLVFCLFFCRRAFVPLAICIAGGVALGGHTVQSRLLSILSGQDTSVALRLAYLKSTGWIIEQFPLGVGWYGYRFVYPTYNYYLADPNVIMYHCHNLFLNVLAELGWQGLMAFLLVWGMFIANAVRLARRGRQDWLRAMGRGYVLASVGIAVGGLTDHVYFNSQLGLLFWTLGILTMLCRKLDSYEA